MHHLWKNGGTKSLLWCQMERGKVTLAIFTIYPFSKNQNEN